MELSSIIFDYGGVISLSQNSSHIRSICRILKIDTAQYRFVYQKFRNAYDSGLISAKQYWQTVIGHIDADRMISAHELNELIHHDVLSWADINQNTYRLIQKLYKNKYKLAILSNMTFDTLRHLMKKTKWMKYFSVRIFSCEEKICKPDKSIFMTTLKRLSEDSANALLIDDSIVNISAAQRIGINSIHYTNHFELAEKLKIKYGIHIY